MRQCDFYGKYFQIIPILIKYWRYIGSICNEIQCFRNIGFTWEILPLKLRNISYQYRTNITTDRGNISLALAKL